MQFYIIFFIFFNNYRVYPLDLLLTIVCYSTIKTSNDTENPIYNILKLVIAYRKLLKNRSPRRVRENHLVLRNFG